MPIAYSYLHWSTLAFCMMGRVGRLPQGQGQISNSTNHMGKDNTLNYLLNIYVLPSEHLRSAVYNFQPMCKLTLTPWKWSANLSSARVAPSGVRAYLYSAEQAGCTCTVTWKWFFFWQTNDSSALLKLNPLSASTRKWGLGLWEKKIK